MDLPNSHQQLLLADLQNHNQTMLPTSDYPLQQSPPNNASNPHLVYVRRKSEGDTPKNTSQLYCHEDIAPPKPHIKVSSFPPFPPFPMPSGNPANPKLFNYVHWEDHYQRLQMFLTKLDQSDQADYIHMLQSLSSVELSKHAVELEKRSIQLSLEEAKELQRVAALNVLGKSVKNFKAPVDHGECSDKLKTLT